MYMEGLYAQTKQKVAPQQRTWPSYTQSPAGESGYGFDSQVLPRKDGGSYGRGRGAP